MITVLMSVISLIAVQVSINGHTMPLSLCEVLSNRILYNGKMVEVIGRVVATDEGEWINQECNEHPMTGSIPWRTIIWLSYDATGEPALQGDLEINKDVMRGAILHILNTAKSADELRDSWVVVYGRFETYDKLEAVPSKDGKGISYNGFGHLNRAPAQIVYRKKDIRYFSHEQIQEILKK